MRPLTAHAGPAGALPQAVTRKVRILDVKYNASNNELVSSSVFAADPSCSSYSATTAAAASRCQCCCQQ